MTPFEAERLIIDCLFQDKPIRSAYIDAQRKKLNYPFIDFLQVIINAYGRLNDIATLKNTTFFTIDMAGNKQYQDQGINLEAYGRKGVIETNKLSEIYQTIQKLIVQYEQGTMNNLDIPNATLDQIIKPEFISRVYDKLEEKKLFNRAAQVWIDKRKGYQCNASRIFLGIPPKYLIEGIELTLKLVKSVLQNTFNISMSLRTTQSALNGINTDFFLH